MLLLLSYLEFTATALGKRQTRTYTTSEESKSKKQEDKAQTHQYQEANPQKNDSPTSSATSQPKEPKQNEFEQPRVCKECKVPGCKMRCDEVGDSYASILLLANTTPETDYAMDSSILTRGLNVKKKTRVKKKEKTRCKKPIREALCTYNLYSSTDDQESDEDRTEELTSNNYAISKIEVLERIGHNAKDLCIVEIMGTFINKYKLLEELLSFADLLIDSNAKHHYTKIEKENRKKSEERRMIRSKKVVGDFAEKYKADYLENFKVDKQIKTDSETLNNIRIYQIMQFFGIVEFERTQIVMYNDMLAQIEPKRQFSFALINTDKNATNEMPQMEVDSNNIKESPEPNIPQQNHDVIRRKKLKMQGGKSYICRELYVSRSMIITLKAYIDKEIDHLDPLITQTPNAQL